MLAVLQSGGRVDDNNDNNDNDDHMIMILMVVIMAELCWQSCSLAGRIEGRKS